MKKENTTETFDFDSISIDLDNYIDKDTLIKL